MSPLAEESTHRPQNSGTLKAIEHTTTANRAIQVLQAPCFIVRPTRITYQTKSDLSNCCEHAASLRAPPGWHCLVNWYTPCGILYLSGGLHDVRIQHIAQAIKTCIYLQHRKHSHLKTTTWYSTSLQGVFLVRWRLAGEVLEVLKTKTIHAISVIKVNIKTELTNKGPQRPLRFSSHST